MDNIQKCDSYNNNNNNLHTFGWFAYILSHIVPNILDITFILT
jgi:hypothetical protein